MNIKTLQRAAKRKNIKLTYKVMDGETIYTLEDATTGLELCYANDKKYIARYLGGLLQFLD